MKLIAQIEVAIQVSPDDWRIVTKTKDIKGSDTIESLIVWVKSQTTGSIITTAGEEIKILEAE